jgi:hypothetical protein
MASQPEYHYSAAQQCLDEIVRRKDDEEFHTPEATMLLRAATAHSLQGLLAAKIHGD